MKKSPLQLLTSAIIILALFSTFLFPNTIFASVETTENTIKLEAKEPKAISFSDTTDTYYKEAINYLQSENLINGYADGTFKPDNTINRAEMLKILVNAHLIINEKALNSIDQFNKTSCFEDVPAFEWFTKYVCYAKSQDWVVGYENGKLFKPSQTIPFVEALKMTLKSQNVNFVEGDPWYIGAVDIASDKKFIPPTINSFYKNITRGEMSEMITRTIKHDQNTLSNYLNITGQESADYDSINQEIDLSNIGPNHYYKKFQLYFVEAESQDEYGLQIGCGDKLIPTKTYLKTPLAGDLIDEIATTLNHLFSIKTELYKDTTLIHPLHYAKMTTPEIIFSEETNTVIVALFGEIESKGFCDNSRIIEQILATVRQFGDFDEILITLNETEISINFSEQEEEKLKNEYE